MNKYPEYIEVNGKQYKINTDFRVALECDEIARDSSIKDYEKCLAIIYKLLGDEGLAAHDDHDVIFKLLIKYLQCGKDMNDLNNDKEPSMNFKQDQGYIKASFLTDYQKDLDKEEIHWWFFNDLLQGLKEDCVLNRVRYIREEPLDGKKGKELTKWQELKKQVALKREKTAEEIELDKYWEEAVKKRGD